MCLELASETEQDASHPHPVDVLRLLNTLTSPLKTPLSLLCNIRCHANFFLCTLYPHKMDSWRKVYYEDN